MGFVRSVTTEIFVCCQESVYEKKGGLGIFPGIESCVEFMVNLTIK